MNNLLAKFLYKTGAPFILRSQKQNRVTILCLHRVSDEESITFPPFKIKDFERLLQYVSKHYQVVTIETLYTLNHKKPGLIFSFDDGFLDIYEYAFPLLKKYGFPCNLNVVTQCLDNNYQIWTQRQNNLILEIFKRKHSCSFDLDANKIIIDNFHPKNILQKNLELFHFLLCKNETFVDEFLMAAEQKMPFIIPATPMMSWEHLKNALKKYEIELGSHSVSHITLPNINNKEKLIHEIAGSKKQIEIQTGRKVNLFAFPNGSYNDEVLYQCKLAGYQHMLTVDEKLLAQNHFSDFKIPRLLIPYHNYFENLLKVENLQNTIKRLINKN
jgi:peptidoglycan/xylan/chitin deacetylase (PgdA/CDA1 family)